MRIVLLALLLTGCAQASWHPLPMQPRALVATPAALPLCVFFCRLTITVGDAEGARVSSDAPVTLTEGSNTQSVSESESTSMGGLSGLPPIVPIPQ